MDKNQEKYTVTLCSSKDNGLVLWTPKAVIRKSVDEKIEDFQLQWNEYFFTRRKADDFALLKAKEWVSGNTGIKKVFTKQEWEEEKIKNFFVWAILIFIGVIIIIAIF